MSILNTLLRVRKRIWRLLGCINFTMKDSLKKMIWIDFLMLGSREISLLTTKLLQLPIQQKRTKWELRIKAFLSKIRYLISNLICKSYKMIFMILEILIITILIFLIAIKAKMKNYQIVKFKKIMKMGRMNWMSPI
jgi:hypothetical protein